jgi:anti-anti-sigma factor
MTASKYFEVQQGQITTIRFVEQELFDSLMVEELRNNLIDFAESETPEKLLLDFSAVEFCSTSVINTLLRLKKVVSRDKTGVLKLCGMKENVLSAFEMLNLVGTVFDIYDTPEDATASFE